MFDEERAKTYDASARTVLAGYEALHETARDALAARLPHDQPCRVLLLGVGTGYEAEHLQKRFPAWQLIGIDPSAPMLAVARQRMGAEADLREGVLEDFPDLTLLDGVLTNGVLHHLPDEAAQIRLITELGQRIRPGGALLLGCQIGPYDQQSLRMQTMRARWVAAGTSPTEAIERSKMYEALAKPPRRSDIETWYTQAGFTAPEVLFSSLYFHLLAATR